MNYSKIKKTVLFIFCFFIYQSLFAQTNITVDLGDEVYSFLEIAEEKGYCCKLSYNKPFTVKSIKERLFEIKEYLEKSNSKYKENELNTTEFYLSRYEYSDGTNWKRLSYRKTNEDEKYPMIFDFNHSSNLNVSSGVYDNKDLNATSFEFIHNMNFVGDIGNNLSYRATGYLDALDIPIQQLGDDYLIGYWWYDGWKEDPSNSIPRTINTFRMNSILPYSYKKKWTGSVYYFSNLSSNGLEGWPVQPSGTFGMLGELRTNILKDKITLGFSRINREWGGMDENSSLFFNYMASPFVAIDAGVKLFDWFSFQTLTGVLEFPNASYINRNAWYRVKADENGNAVKDNSISNIVDSYFFQNAYSIGMFNLDFDYVHFDFGSTCVWPKRFELGYMFPLIDRVIYQNSVGDFDNLALFSDLKGFLPGIGSLWGSIYIEELNSLKPHMFEKTRCMFAYQAGTKAVIPFLPFTTITTRYTKIEPYCYTHQAIRKQPWYSEYINEPYANNGHSLGYYLDPNSDEIFVRIESKPYTGVSAGLQYQLVRHGADYGSAQVPGSSIWSELPIGNRNIYYKNFLHDGAYEWTHIIKFDGSYNFNALNLPITLTSSFGFVYDYFTVSKVVGTKENNYFANKKTPYHKINNEEYPSKKGFVFTLGVKLYANELCN